MERLKPLHKLKTVYQCGFYCLGRCSLMARRAPTGSWETDGKRYCGVQASTSLKNVLKECNRAKPKGQRVPIPINYFT